MRRQLWAAGLAALMLGLAGAVVYWTQFALLLVVAYAMQRDEIVAEVMGTGTLDTQISATISPKISGLITEVNVDRGDRVQRGQVMVQLRDADFGDGDAPIAHRDGRRSAAC